MVSTFHSIETAKRSLFTQTAALNTTGHNISNANTEGYSRQVVKMTASSPMEPLAFLRSTNPGQLGSGVEFSAIERVRQGFLDSQYRSENSSLGNWEVQYDTLDKIQGIMTEPSDTGLQTVLDNFWGAWSDLSKDPENLTARNIVKETALALTDAMNLMSNQLNGLSQDLTNNVGVKAQEIQGYITSIGELNQTISRIESLGDNANDLRDQRDLLTDKLSKIANVTVTENEQGYNISIGGQELVNGTAVTQVTSDLLTDAYAAGDLTGGEVYGMIVSRDQFVTGFQNDLNQLANTIANGDVTVKIPAGSSIREGTVASQDTVITVNGVESTVAAGQAFPAGAVLKNETPLTVQGINGLHQLGYALDGSASAGIPFFTSTDGGPITAGNITLNQVIQSNPNAIASSLRVDANGNAIKGNNTMANLMGSLKDQAFTVPGGTDSTTINDYYKSMVGELGIQTQEAYRKATNSTSLVIQVENSRQSVSGVSLDEEMSNMIKFQHAYSASARFMTTFDELLDKLINSTGTVGR
ncbi:flagellar hook-associated protein FlgK [Paenibacillus urinalis]|uniref:Flagellar hook-associated protein 1 n=1 Tax=Paenibacillus urinalis TaxID=521520 RepID=A0ABY7XAR9_9BACL|nr:flagellar hook-associated protein FlgK [Paenibacillus urinalis]WDH98289.1 flagellar hook-associated protein FlgK [Paenibacillus urinalis]WDI01975.1 flagellar hook-associated protein FlgK [Paenibacillus urinalis]